MKQTITLLFALIGMFTTTSCNTEVKKTPPPKPFPIVEVKKQDIASYYSFPAEISGKNNNQVRSKISGYILEVLIDEGAKVEEGQALFKLETNIQDQNADAAQAQVSSSLAIIDGAKAGVQAAQVEVDKLIPLVEKDIVSNIQLETARANLLKAKGQLSQAQAGYSAAQANYQGVKENIKFSTITSPINGIVGKLNSRTGSLVGPSDPKPITTVSDVSEVYAYFSVNERQYIYFFQKFPGASLEDKISLIPPIDLELANGSLFEEKGEVETSTGQIDPATGTIEFRVKFENKNGLLSNGNTGKIRVPRMYENVLVVPESATYEQQGFTYVYKSQGDSVISVMIEVKDRVNNMAIVEKGLEEGELVVGKGVGNLKNRMKITPQEVSIDSLIRFKTVK
ncbi:MAG TPA: efflux RND transporter periplasmic adaptor subunit [Flavobacteriales bacterium]|nr:efflux RND transporter periplasmic adaptor subunit [Flavobacteriales bacterium]